MELIIGRDGATAKLKVVEGTKVHLLGDAASVPMDVSRQHCYLEVKDNDIFVIKNIKAENKTWVNGTEIQSKSITLADKVQLGEAGRYVLPLEEIIGILDPTIIDISPLQEIWNNYNNGLIAIRKRQQRNNLLARAPMIFTLLGGVVTSALAATNYNATAQHYSLAFTIIAALVMAYGYFLQATDKGVEQQENLRKTFQASYICPNPKCKHFLGFLDYDLISRNTHCPYCKAEYKK